MISSWDIHGHPGDQLDMMTTFGHRPENGPFINQQSRIHEDTMAGGWLTYSEKSWTSSVGFTKFPTEWKVITAMFQSPPTRWDIPGDHHFVFLTAVLLTAPPTEDMFLESCTHPLVYHRFPIRIRVFLMLTHTQPAYWCF